jgi:mannose-1-phosphate guanylyltransferase / mannose-6-phosphate isomerase
MKKIAVILSGGAGTRLWPVSRHALPKPFMRIAGKSLFRQAVERGLACGVDQCMIVTNHAYQFLSEAEISKIDPLLGAVPQKYLLEPKGRNTAPAIALAALSAQAEYGDDVALLVLPADHLIPDQEAYVASAMLAMEAAASGQLVTFGIQPTTPETGFGYIEVARQSRGPLKAIRFVEKPDAATAREYLATGRFYWNSGMFCFTAGSFLQSLALHSPDVLQASAVAFSEAQIAKNVIHFEATSFARQPDISIDYALMERASNVTLVPAQFTWSDVGNWPAIASAHPADHLGNTIHTGDEASAAVHLVHVSTTNTHVHVQSHIAKTVATVGVSDLVVIDTPDALLVAHKATMQGIKSVVDQLKVRPHGSPEYETTQLPAVVRRPWGTYARLKEESGNSLQGSGYKVKRITVRPKQSLSLKYHHQRAEHWIVVKGTAKVQIGDEEFITSAGEYRYIPLKEKHRLTNVGDGELVLIEVQCGSYLGEEDIVRLSDTYGRV